MSTDAYQPPEAELEPAKNEGSVGQPYYAVSTKKLLVMYFVTGGIYLVYWFYENWRRQKIVENNSSIPVLRAIFSVFFTHALFNYAELDAKKHQPDYHWASNSWATAFVIVVIVNYFFGRLVDKVFFESMSFAVVPLLLMPVTAYIIYQAQRTINIACNDVDGVSNGNFTVYNILWMIMLGLLSWSSLLAVIFLPLYGT